MNSTTSPSPPAALARAHAKARFRNSMLAAVLAAMREQNVTITELARRTGRSKQAISRALQLGANMETGTMFDLAWALGREWALELPASGARPAAGPAQVEVIGVVHALGGLRPMLANRGGSTTMAGWARTPLDQRPPRLLVGQAV